ncbi:MAG: hypothetical protein RIF33_03060 [Cyclobacteriaceae bacterium]
MRHFFILLLFASPSLLAQELPSKDIQISTAIMAAPESEKSVATVMGYSSLNGTLEVIREGSGDVICLTDDPTKSGFGVSCYHKDLEPFMARGRVLKADGLNGQEVFDKREEEVKAGSLSMPEDPTTLYVLTAPDDQYDRNTGEVSNSYLRYVIYIPYATVESTGLPLSPENPGMPWIMDPGTHRAHIMINPPPK